MRPAPAGNRTFAPFPPRGTDLGPDLFALYAEANGLTLQQAVTHLARAAGLLPEPAEREAEAL
jgi:hypothetical protein